MWGVWWIPKFSISLNSKKSYSMKQSKNHIYTMECYVVERKKNGMDGTGEYHAKWNKPGGEREIPFDLTCKWNLVNNTNKWAK